MTPKKSMRDLRKKIKADEKELSILNSVIGSTGNFAFVERKDVKKYDDTFRRAFKNLPISRKYQSSGLKTTSGRNNELFPRLNELFRAYSVDNAQVAILGMNDGEQDSWNDAQPQLECRSLEESFQAEHSTANHSGGAIFAIGEVTQTFIVAALAIAAERSQSCESDKDPYFHFGRVFLDSMNDLYNEHKAENDPDLPQLPGRPRCDHLMTGYNGVPSARERTCAPDGSSLCTVEEAIREVKNTIDCFPVISRDGGWTCSSNFNYALIAKIICLLWNGSLNDFMWQTLFEPLGMSCTTIGFPKSAENYAGRHVVNMAGTSKPYEFDEHTSGDADEGAVGGYSSLRDMVRFEEFILRTLNGEDIVPGATKQNLTDLMSCRAFHRPGKTTKPRTEVTPLGTYHQETNYQQIVLFGTTTSKALKEPSFRQLGRGVGVNCCTVLYPESMSAVVILTNTSCAGNVVEKALDLIVGYLASVANGREWKPPLSLCQKPESERLQDKQWTQKTRTAVRFGSTYEARGSSLKIRITETHGSYALQLIGSLHHSRLYNFSFLDGDKIELNIPASETLQIDDDWNRAEHVFQFKTEKGKVVHLRRKVGICFQYWDLQECSAT